MNSTRYALLEALYEAVTAQIGAQPELLSIVVLAAHEAVARHDGAPLVSPDQYDDANDPDGRNWAYIGRHPCGHVRAAQADDPRYRDQVAQGVAEMIQAGMIIERVPVAYVRARFGGHCAVCKPPKLQQAEMPL